MKSPLMEEDRTLILIDINGLMLSKLNRIDNSSISRRIIASSMNNHTSEKEESMLDRPDGLRF